ncbi:MAG: hypothetical protein LBD11_06070 [Candidatus Peribacteria bacterium]|nr:hypothetical protein [Candidatus Peribacteria bacterium]
MQKEITSGRGGMSISDGYKQYVKKEMTEEDFKATVPMCIDNEFSSVEKLLSEGGYYGYLRAQKLGEWTALLK